MSRKEGKNRGADARSIKETRYFVIFTEKEGSFSTVPEQDIIYDEAIEIGDTVTYFWNKKAHEGVVRFISDNYDVCCSKALEFKAELKKAPKDDSFHEDRPRKSALKCKENMFLKKEKKCMINKKSAKKSKEDIDSAKLAATSASDLELLQMVQAKMKSRDSKPRNISSIYDEEERTSDDVAPQKAEKTNEKLTLKDPDSIEIPSSSGDESADGDSSSSEDEKRPMQPSKKAKYSSSTDENESKLLKLAAQLATKYDMKTLERLIADRDAERPRMKGISTPKPAEKSFTSKNDSKSASAQISEEEPASSFVPKELPSHCTTPRVDEEEVTIQSNSSSASQSVSTRDETPSASVLHMLKTASQARMFSGDMYLVNGPPDGKAIGDKKEIYCLESCWDKADSSKSTTMAARKLLEGVFTGEALASSSITGMPPRGKGKAAYAERGNIKPYLCPNAIKAIIEEAQRMETEHHWRPKKDKNQIRQALAVRMGELAARCGGLVEKKSE